MTYREELLERVKQDRISGGFGKIDDAILNALPVQQTEMTVPATKKGVHLFELRPESTKGTKAAMILDFHGGGFIKGRADRDFVFCSHLAADLNVVIWDVDYVLAPEYPFPAAINEAHDLFLYVVKHADEIGIDPEKIILMGHSSGSAICAASCVQAAEEGIEYKPAAMVLDYMPTEQYTNPYMKLTAEQRKNDEKAMARCAVEVRYQEYYSTRTEAIDPKCSLDLAGPELLCNFPDTLLINGANDPLHNKAEIFAHNLQAAGVVVTMKRFPNSGHSFVVNKLGAWEDAWKLQRKYLKQYI